ncbi:MAG: ABC transporter permease [Clostridia bacterium]|nr:ABC transporter permease [Clostridia bacterium]MBQ9506391.1 ABC transporter permease [Clostridia bacterium]
MSKGVTVGNKKANLFPFSSWMVLFVLVPIALVVYYAFTDVNGFTLSNLKWIVTYRNTLWLSIELALIATVICVLLAYPIAYSMSRASARVQRNATLFIMLPMWMNFLVRTYAWMTLLEDNGLINSALRAIFGMEFPGLHLINNHGAIVLGMVYNYLPYMILPIYTSLTKIGQSLIEAARDLGANGSQVFGRVILPMSVPGIISGITMVFIPSISTFIISKILGGGKDFLIGDLIEDYFLGNSGVVNYNIGAALSLVIMVMILAATFIMNHFDKDAQTSGGGVI